MPLGKLVNRLKNYQYIALTLIDYPIISVTIEQADYEMFRIQTLLYAGGQ
jgi:hypothetical protein